ncbi:hypothetical protein GGR42_002694 [Saonia flava]|uniref:Uncharacterized protein n=1 Tax=Saonia flava TaxID=523696 RepID=A0A846R199_9FLAO|nr:hypothetical protein [Saonia flava]NJB72203.1 hypothetical protein [Saonia flava]
MKRTIALTVNSTINKSNTIARNALNKKLSCAEPIFETTKNGITISKGREERGEKEDAAILYEWIGSSSNNLKKIQVF